MLNLLRGSYGGATGAKRRAKARPPGPAYGARGRPRIRRGAGRTRETQLPHYSEGATEHGGDAAQVYCPPLREIRLSP
ncbi:hypothetical protein GCM10018787_18770 [Streptomyces thermodiastaticus]|nr:hypothetical protein GCM10018787_18770 [Streptomyces thermodiastaticus]